MKAMVRLNCGIPSGPNGNNLKEMLRHIDGTFKHGSTRYDDARTWKLGKQLRKLTHKLHKPDCPDANDKPEVPLY